ncbi:LysR family transcriptional regulator [uncultured Dechloromonas sp.]|uniref:LysR family transcriptional regulator n=1 Tax=uncultured Dechloromonas sp. TaxID=171719 RepID=UPI0025F3832C|nr:LysR family transcriptional regulator [uncultured Dechloromonas sp.]
MDILKLKSFVMVARLGQVTKAADRLCLTQPAVTAHLKAIEEELGIVLFTRSPGKIVLTKAGELLLDEAEHVLDTFNGLLHKAKQIKGEITGNLLVGTVEDAEFIRLGAFLYNLQNALPLLKLGFRSCPAEELLAGVANGELDAGFHIGHLDQPEFARIALRSVRYLVVGPRALAERLVAANWRELAEMPWLTPPAKSHIRRLQQQLFAQQGLQARETLGCDQISALEELVRAGLGLTLLREERALQAVEEGHAVIWPHAAIDVPLSFIYRQKNESHPTTIGMLSVLRECWNL